MATWEDGPEYAPVERPDAFSEPTADTVGLEAPPAPAVPPPAPVERPVFADPQQAVPQLDTLVPVPPDQRDPSVPFDVASSVMTADTSAWASAHWSSPGQSGPAQGPTQPGPPQAGPSAPAPYAPPPGPSPAPRNGTNPYGPSTNGHTPTFPTPGPQFPPPSQPFPNFPAPGQPTGGPFPAPGTEQWFAPGPYQQQPPVASAPTARAVVAALTPGVLITLVLGGFIWILAPVTLIVAFLLSSRMTYGRKPTRTVFAAVLAFVGLAGLLSLITADGVFSQWWETVAGWACAGSWATVVAALICVHRALKLGRPDPPPTRRSSR